MFDAATSALVGVLLGLSLAAPPGPMNAIIAEESVLRGFGAGVRAGMGAAVADGCFFVLALLGVTTVLRALPTVHAVMVGAGGLLMLYFAVGAATDARESFTTGVGGESGVGRDGSIEGDGGVGGNEGVGGNGGVEGDGGIEDGGAGFRKTFVLALTNPYQILWWLTFGVGLLEAGRTDLGSLLPFVDSLVVTTGSVAIVVGFFAGILAWVVGFSGALVAAGRRVDRFAPAVASLSALTLAGFGVLFLYDAVTKLA